MNAKKLDWLLKSRAYRKARDLVNATVQSPERLSSLISDTQKKLGRYKDNSLSGVTEPISTAIRLIKAYTSGEYREIPFESLAMIVASIIYFVMPIDVIPDFILALGHIDDVALLTWTLRSVAKDIDRFLIWETSKKSSNNQPKTLDQNDKSNS